MNKSIIELIASEQSASAVSLVEKVLAKKLLKAISEQAKGVARNTYGTVSESFGADEQPEFMNPADNTYAVFFANALKKFGVNGPQDFKDEATKQQFFQYVDNNWKAQDSVQGIASQAPSGATMDQGTQTQLPPTATQPAAPQGPMQTPLDTTQPGTAMAQSNGAALPQGGQNDGSLSGMSPTGNSGGNMGLTPGTGNDPGLDMAQNAQQMGGTTCQSCGQPMPEPQTCQCCGQPMPAGMPGQPQPGQQVQPGADMGDDDSDPDLEIGDEDVADDNDQFGQDPDDEQNGGFSDNDPNAMGDDEDSNFGGDGDGDEDDQETDEDGNPIVSDDDDTEETDEDGNPIVSDDDSGDDEDSDDSDEDEDDPFSDDDAYSVNPNDFNSDDEDQDDDDEDSDEDGDPDLEVGDDDSDEDDSDDDGYDDEADDEDADDSDDSDDDGYDDEDDDGDGDQEVVVPAPKKKSKNPFAEDFGFGADNAADQQYITEVLDPMIMKSKGIDNHTHRKAKRAKGDLKQVLQSRNSHLSMLKKRRREILADPGKSDKQKKRAVQYISQLAKRHRGHCKEQAQGIKALHTGKF